MQLGACSRDLEFTLERDVGVALELPDVPLLAEVSHLVLDIFLVGTGRMPGFDTAQVSGSKGCSTSEGVFSVPYLHARAVLG